MTPLQRRYLAEIGIPVWRLRTAPAAPAAAGGARSDAGHAGLEHAAPMARAPLATAVAPNAPPAPAGLRETEPAASAAGQAHTWETLAAAVRGCTLCGLHKTRTQTVFGVGRRDARLLVIGEAPGAEEDRQGEPFVGRAGQLLNAMLLAIGFERGDVYIANILKCRPPNNRDPQPAEASACTPYLDRQIALVAPRAILAVGRIAAQWLLQSDAPIGRLRGKAFQYGPAGTPLVITYHPAYLLRTPIAKATAWQDLCMVKELLSRES